MLLTMFIKFSCYFFPVKRFLTCLFVTHKNNFMFDLVGQKEDGALFEQGRNCNDTAGLDVNS